MRFRVTNRSPLGRLLLSVVVLASACAAAQADEAVKPLRALLIAGGCCHDYDAQSTILPEGIRRRANIEWTVVVQGGGAKDVKIPVYDNPDWAKGFDVIVHDECFGGVDDVEFVERISKAHRGGLPAVMLHCSAHSYRAAKTDQWRKLLGATSFSHEKNRPLEVKNVAQKHPIMAGFPAVWSTPSDELYKIDKLWPNAEPLGQAYGQDTKKDHVCIWTNTYGKARVFSTTLGHGNETVRHEVYLDLVARGLLWTCGKLDDQGHPLPGYAGTGVAAEKEAAPAGPQGEPTLAR